MFFADSLSQKLKVSMDKYGLNQNDKCLFPYKIPKQKPIIIPGLKKNAPEFTHEQLKEMTKEDFLNKFTIKRLQNKWARKFPLNYEISNTKFGDEFKLKGVKEAKEYIKDLLDRDIFEKKNPKWNNSTKPDYIIKSKKLILKKALYDANHGYNNYLPSKKQKKLTRANSVGVHSYYNSYWNVSSKLEQKEKNELDKELLEKSFNNTQKYWLKNNYRRKNELEYPLSSEMKQIEEPKYFKIYKDPKALVEYNYEMMKKAKNDLWIEKEKIYKQEKENHPNFVEEKINYLVNKRMESKYKEKFENLKNNKNMNMTDINKNKKMKTHWKDRELIDRMKLIEELKDINWIHPDQTYNPEDQKREIFKELVCNKDKILKEQEKIKEEREIEKYHKMRIEELQSKKNGKNKISPLQYSKYPITKDIYEYNKKIKDNPKTINIYSNNDDDNTENINVEILDSNPNSDNLSKRKNDNYEKKLFLEAYKRIILEKENKKEKMKNRAMSCKITKKYFYDVKYIHPGIYRHFNYVIKLGKDKVKEEKFMAWSCCNNTDKKAIGCQRTLVRKEKNFGFP